MTDGEMQQTITNWIKSDKYANLTDYSISYKQKNSIEYTLYIKFQKPPKDFFLALQDRSLVLGIIKKDSQYFIDKVLDKNQNSFKTNDYDSSKSTATSSKPIDTIVLVANYLIKNDIDNALSLFSDDVWLQNYNMLFSKESLRNFFLEWKRNNNNIKSTAELIDVEALSIVDEKQHNYFENSGMEFADFFQVQVIFKANAFVPGEPNINKYIFVVEAYSDNLDKFRIVGVTQTIE